MEHSESYTCVTNHAHGTKHIYIHCSMENEIVQSPVHVPKLERQEQQIWDVESPRRSHSNVPVFPVADFLTACYLCKRQLNHEKDIYMYRGDKAFCSMECRYQQIIMDDAMVLPTDFDG